jgi:hypothetical protein
MRTSTRLFVLAVMAAGTFAAPARGDGGASPGVNLGDKGIADSRGTTYATEPAGNLSTLVVRNRSGRIVKTRTFDAVFGIPRVTFGSALGGLSRDGRTLIVAQAQQGGGLVQASRLLVLDTRTLRTRHQIDLAGDFSFDALSPNARTLFLIQHTSARDYERYRVRAYDLVRGHLLPRPIVDKTEPNMRGFPVARLEGPGGAWVYTLYMHQGGEPFVHALDTAHARARCLDIDWHGNQMLLWSARLKLDRGRLAVLLKGNKRIASLELHPRASGFAAGWIAAIVLAAMAGVVALGVWYVRGRPRLRLRSLAMQRPGSSKVG